MRIQKRDFHKLYYKPFTMWVQDKICTFLYMFTEMVFFGILNTDALCIPKTLTIELITGVSMKVTGIIAEYNPFHNGHFYQLEKIKKETDTDYLVVVLSGDFVQRGVPAIVDKYARTKMALACGADLVIELPALWATASAEYFAAAGIACLDHLGVVNQVCFGAECPDLKLLSHLADILTKEPLSYRQKLVSLLKEGLPFPAARMESISDYLSKDSSTLFPTEEIRSALGSPNNILAIEYLKELKKRESSIAPYPILRNGNGYHDTELTPLASATAIRRLLVSQPNHPHGKIPVSDDTKEQLLFAMPKKACMILLDYMKEFPLINEDDFSSMLKYKLLSAAPDGFEYYADCNRDLSNRMKGNLYQFRSFSGFCEQLKSKETTYSRFSRILLHILLNIYQKDYELGRELDYIPYLRVLGFRKAAALLLGQIKTKSKLPLLTKMANADKILNDMYSPDSFAHRMLTLDIFAADLYTSAVTGLSGSVARNEFNHEIVIE